ncbi:helix-turn-helix domain-containing protein [Caballeronia sp. 15715]|uniref:helix-turn-helix domain-containing protein n=1 Tax=Caballeronia sp. 15715 TaxID=3391030 RepID=UPI0039E69C63
MPTALNAAAHDRMLSTGEVATILNVSRPYVVRLADSGQLGAVKRNADGRRLIPAAAVEDYRREQNSNATIALNELAVISQEAGLYDAGGQDD